MVRRHLYIEAPPGFYSLNGTTSYRTIFTEQTNIDTFKTFVCVVMSSDHMYYSTLPCEWMNHGRPGSAALDLLCKKIRHTLGHIQFTPQRDAGL